MDPKKRKKIKAAPVGQWPTGTVVFGLLLTGSHIPHRTAQA